MRVKVYPGVLLLGLVLALAGCGGGDKTTTVIETVTTATAPAQSPEKALAAVLERNRQDPSFHVTGFKSGEQVTAAFINRVEQATQDAKDQGATGLDFDPMVCAQQIPQHIEYHPATVSGDQATVIATLDFGGGKPQSNTYQMRLEDGVWKLDSTECLK